MLLKNPVFKQQRGQRQDNRDILRVSELLYMYALVLTHCITVHEKNSMRLAVVLHTSVERMMPIQISSILQTFTCRNKVQLYL